MYSETRSPLHPGKFDRILLAVNVLILILLGVGIPVFLVGRALNNIPLSTIAAYLILIGILALIMRIIYWLAEAMFKRGAEAMANESQMP